ncbi:MAG TPA: choice-of-anchor Q domain-containing protein [Thermoleophilaceae bacterium]
MKVVRLAPTAAVLLALTLAAPARAGVFNVNTTTDSASGTCTPTSCSIRQAINSSNASADDDVINIPGSTGHYLVTSNLPAFTNSNVTIQGAGTLVSVVDGGGTARLFNEQTTGKALAINSLTLTAGQLGASGANTGGAAVHSRGTDLTLSGDAFTGNTTTITSGNFNGGGAVFFGGSGNLTIANCSFSGNSLTVTSSTGNSGGGAIFLSTGVPVAISQTSFATSTANITASGSTNGGGAIHSEGPALTLTDVSITGSRLTLNNPQTNGGGGGYLGNSGSPLKLTRVNISGNSYTHTAGGGSGLGGGGINDQGAPLTLTDSEVSGNSVDVNTATGDSGGGGGILANTGSAMTITGSSISNNSSNLLAGNNSGGGGLNDQGAPATISNTTFSGNRSLPKSGDGALRGGGAMLFKTGSAIALNGLTVAGNSAEGEGGGLLSSGAAVAVRDSIFSGGTRTTGATTTGDNCTISGGTFTSQGNNVESLNTCGFAAAGDKKNTDPLLGPLGAHGGTSTTQMLLAGSPALNAGANCLATDQRGVPRPQAGVCDIGAVEDQAVSVATGTSKATATTAALAGTVNPLFTAGSYHFDFGKTSAYGSSTPTVSVGDGGAALAAAATVTKLKPHTTYHFRLVASNALGTVAGADAVFLTPFPNPSVSKFAVVPKRFRRAPGRTAKTARAVPRGTAFRFTLNEKARVQIRIYRKLPGRRSKGKCRAPSKKLAHAKRCTRLKLAGTLTRRSLKKGRNRVKFTGRIGRKALAPGAYQANVVAIVKGALKSRSRARHASFKFLRG